MNTQTETQLKNKIAFSKSKIILLGIILSMISANLFVAILVNIFWPDENHEMVYTLSIITSFVVSFGVSFYIVENNFRQRFKLEKLSSERSEELIIISEELRKNQKSLQKLNDSLEERILEEITKNNQHEKFLLKQSMIVNFKELIGNIVGDWKQPLSVITTLSSSINYRAHNNIQMEQEATYKDLETIIHQAQLLSQKVDHFHTLVCEEQTYNCFDLNQEIDDIQKILYKAITQYKIDFRVELNSDSSICTLQKQLCQAIINIFYHSRDMFLINKTPYSQRVFYIKTYSDETNITIQIKDSSGHISKDEIENAFQANYLTTNDKIGIGLYISHNIITENLQGKILIGNSVIKHMPKPLKGLEYLITIPKELQQQYF